MKNVIRVLAKEVRRLRVLVEVAEESGVLIPVARGEFEFTKRMLAMLIKGEM